MEEKREKSLFRRVVGGTFGFAFDIAFIALMLFLLLFAGYARWDSQQMYTQADPIQFIQYKPSPPEMMNFEELQALNPDVLGWITIYDTNIDYPLVIGEDNEKYLNRNPKLESTGSGSLFMDYRNNRNFTDFNALIYGHHMAHHEMFGDLDLFLDEDFWNKHEYGNLIYDAQNHGLQFVAMLQCDAYDFFIYHPAVNSEEQRVKYINRIYETAKYVRGVDTEHLRDMQKQEAARKKALKEAGVTDTNAEDSVFYKGRTSPVTPDDHIVLLSTCSADITNGRFILVAKILDHPVENPYPDTTPHTVRQGIDTAKITARIGKYSVQTWIFILILLILLVLTLYILSNYLYKKKLDRENGENAYDQHEENA